MANVVGAASVVPLLLLLFFATLFTTAAVQNINPGVGSSTCAPGSSVILAPWGAGQVFRLHDCNAASVQASGTFVMAPTLVLERVQAASVSVFASGIAAGANITIVSSQITTALSLPSTFSGSLELRGSTIVNVMANSFDCSLLIRNCNLYGSVIQAASLSVSQLTVLDTNLSTTVFLVSPSAATIANAVIERTACTVVADNVQIVGGGPLTVTRLALTDFSIAAASFVVWGFIGSIDTLLIDGFTLTAERANLLLAPRNVSARRLDWTLNASQPLTLPFPSAAITAALSIEDSVLRCGGAATVDLFRYPGSGGSVTFTNVTVTASGPSATIAAGLEATSLEVTRLELSATGGPLLFAAALNGSVPTVRVTGATLHGRAELLTGNLTATSVVVEDVLVSGSGAKLLAFHAAEVPQLSLRHITSPDGGDLTVLEAEALQTSQLLVEHVAVGGDGRAVRLIAVEVTAPANVTVHNVSLNGASDVTFLRLGGAMSSLAVSSVSGALTSDATSLMQVSFTNRTACFVLRDVALQTAATFASPDVLSFTQLGYVNPNLDAAGVRISGTGCCTRGRHGFVAGVCSAGACGAIDLDHNGCAATPTASLPPSATPSPLRSPTTTRSVGPSPTATTTTTRSVAPVPTVSPTATSALPPTATSTATSSVTLSPSLTVTGAPAATPSPLGSRTPSVSRPATPSVTVTPGPSPSCSPSRTGTGTASLPSVTADAHGATSTASLQAGRPSGVRVVLPAGSTVYTATGPAVALPGVHAFALLSSGGADLQPAIAALVGPHSITDGSTSAPCPRYSGVCALNLTRAGGAAVTLRPAVPSWSPVSLALRGLGGDPLPTVAVDVPALLTAGAGAQCVVDVVGGWSQGAVVRATSGGVTFQWHLDVSGGRAAISLAGPTATVQWSVTVGPVVATATTTVVTCGSVPAITLHTVVAGSGPTVFTLRRRPGPNVTHCRWGAATAEVERASSCAFRCSFSATPPAGLVPLGLWWAGGSLEAEYPVVALRPPFRVDLIAVAPAWRQVPGGQRAVVPVRVLDASGRRVPEELFLTTVPTVLGSGVAVSTNESTVEVTAAPAAALQLSVAVSGVGWAATGTTNLSLCQAPVSRRVLAVAGDCTGWACRDEAELSNATYIVWNGTDLRCNGSGGAWRCRGHRRGSNALSVSVTPALDTGHLGIQERLTVLATTPVVHRASGCVDAHPSTGCSTDGSAIVLEGVALDTASELTWSALERPTRCTLTGNATHATCFITEPAAAAAAVRWADANGTARVTPIRPRVIATADCPWSPAGFCQGHGQCRAACHCDASDSLGYYTGADCGACAPFYAGSAGCDQRCPGSVVPCNGRGTCANGTCTCHAGSAGPSCDRTCPRDNARRVCGGHGACSVTGACVCATGWAGPQCTACTAPGCDASDDGSCSGHGQCRGGGCECDSFYAGVECTLECPRTAFLVCGGHGTCNDTSLGDARCQCDHGFSGADCSAACPRTPQGVECSGHGQCDGAVCRCSESSAEGYWAGDACTNCASGYGGTSCTTPCPTAGGLVCGGHGRCGALGTCVCDASEESGFWGGDSCSSCLPPYAGTSCTHACPGSVCEQCSGHGTCSYGVAGSGRCTCAADPAAGFWAGTACDQCAPQWAGLQCDTRCPTTGGMVCGGHGRCSEGRSGTGRCGCDTGYALDGNGTCTGCASLHFGPGCAPCKTVAGGVCSGRGRCNEGTSGDGLCSACAVGFGGPFCEHSCPAVANATCGGHGACRAVSGTLGRCVCSAAFVQDPTGTCTVCSPGHYGSACAQCPQCPARFVCADGGSGSGLCVCAPGTGGTGCLYQCPRGNDGSVCSGHGTCDPATAQCVCDASPVNGYFAGPSCAVCAEGHSGPGCSIPCPRSGGAVCGGRGRCDHGTCVACTSLAGDPPGTIVCGVACDRTGTQCVDSAAACGGCSGVGWCNATSGACDCPSGRAGAHCAVACPRPCGLHGRCSPITAHCVCDSGYWGAGCEVQCGGLGGSPCSGRGTCLPDGTCDCALGYAGQTCTDSCPVTAEGICGGHGRCGSGGECQCTQGFEGATCAVCIPGRSGPDCTMPCVHGNTQGTACVCFGGFAGPECSLECEGRCSGRGTCTVVAGAPSCLCPATWYGPLCDRRCTVAACKASGLEHPQCDSDGACECQSSGAGMWAGPRCEVCRSGYWGLACSLTCPCNGHGSCDRMTGECFCYRDVDRGFWDGTRCERCTADRVGTRCVDLNVPVTADSRWQGLAPFPLAEDPSSAASPGGRTALWANITAGTAVAAFGQQGRVVLFNGGPPLRAARTTVLGSRVLALAAVNASHIAALTAAMAVRLLPVDPAAWLTLQHPSRARVLAPSTASAALSGPHVFIVDAAHGTLRVVSAVDGSVVFDAPLGGFATVTRVDVTHGNVVVAGRGLSGRWRVAWGAATPPVAPAFFDVAEGDGPCQEALRCVIPGTLSAAFCVVRCGTEIAVVTHIAAPSNRSLVTLPADGRSSLAAAVLDLRAARAVVALEYADGSRPRLIAVALRWNGASSVTGVAPLYSAALASVALAVSGSHAVVAAVRANTDIAVTWAPLYHVVSVSPSVLDGRLTQNLTLTIATRHVPLSEPVVCHIGPTTLPARRVTSSAVLCGPPPLQVSGLCFALDVRVSIRGVQASRDGRQVVLVPPAAPVSMTAAGAHTVASAVLEAVPSVAAKAVPALPLRRAVVATVHGRGFVASAEAACRGIDGAGRVLFTAAALVDGPTLFRCAVPRLEPTRPPAVLQYSHDGVHFSSGAPFAVVGPPAGLAVIVDAPVVVAAVTSPIPATAVLVTDTVGNAVLGTSSSVAAAVRCAAVGVGQAEHQSFFVGGVAVFPSGLVTLRRPAAGAQWIRCTSATFAGSAAVRVVPGTPVALELGSAVASTTWRVSVGAAVALDPPPVVRAVDAAGNAIVDETLLPVTATAQWATEHLRAGSVVRALQSSFAVRENKEFGFANPIAMRGLYGESYTLTFAATAPTGAQLRLSLSLPAQRCPGRAFEFAVDGTEQCRGCPTLAVCDGTSLMQPRPGAWRAVSTAVTFYRCADYQGSCSAGGAGACDRGYHGVTCAECESGYARSLKACTKCWPAWVNWPLLGVMYCGLSAVIYVLTVRSLREGRDLRGTKSDFSVVIKMLLSHLQLVGIAGTALSTAPALVRDTLRVSGSAGSPLSVPLPFFACTLGGSLRSRLVVAMVGALCSAGGACAIHIIVLCVKRLVRYLGSDDSAAAPLAAAVRYNHDEMQEVVLLKPHAAERLMRMLERTDSQYSGMTGMASAQHSTSQSFRVSKGLLMPPQFSRAPSARSVRSSRRSSAQPMVLPLPSLIIAGHSHSRPPSASASAFPSFVADHSRRSSRAVAFGDIPSITVDPRECPVAEPLGESQASLKSRLSTPPAALSTTTLTVPRLAPPFAALRPPTSQTQGPAEQPQPSPRLRLPGIPAASTPSLNGSSTHRPVATPRLVTPRGFYTTETPEETQEAAVPPARSVGEFAAVSLVVALFLTYPTVIQHAASALRCGGVDYGARGQRSFVVSDRRYDCDSVEYRGLSSLAWVGIAVVGVGAPLLSLGLVYAAAWVLFGGDAVRARRLFHYSTGGYSPTRWYWESVFLLRKAVVVVVATVIGDVLLKAYAVTWAFSVAMALSAAVNPFNKDRFAQLERISLLSLLVTSNAVVLMQEVTDGGAVHWLLTLLVLAVNLLALVALLLAVLYAVSAEVSKRRSHPALAFLVRVVEGLSEFWIARGYDTVVHEAGRLKDELVTYRAASVEHFTATYVGTRPHLHDMHAHAADAVIAYDVGSATEGHQVLSALYHAESAILLSLRQTLESVREAPRHGHEPRNAPLDVAWSSGHSLHHEFESLDAASRYASMILPPSMHVHQAAGAMRRTAKRPPRPTPSAHALPVEHSSAALYPSIPSLLVSGPHDSPLCGPKRRTSGISAANVSSSESDASTRPPSPRRPTQPAVLVEHFH